MTPVFQRIICPDRGDCMSACLASLLDLPADAVPNFLADEFDRNPEKARAYREKDAHIAMIAWIRSMGYAYTTLPWQSISDWRGLKDLHLIASVPSQKFPGVDHAVVVGWRQHPEYQGAFEWHVAHDPNPGNVPYNTSEIKPHFVDLLLPLTYAPLP